MSDSYQRSVIGRLARFLVRFLPKEGRVGYSDRFLQTQLTASIEISRAVSPDGEISPSRVARFMLRNHGVVMPDSLGEDQYYSVEIGESE